MKKDTEVTKSPEDIIIELMTRNFEYKGPETDKELKSALQEVIKMRRNNKVFYLIIMTLAAYNITRSVLQFIYG